VGYTVFLRNSDVFVAARHAQAVIALIEDTGYIVNKDDEGNIDYMDYDSWDMRNGEELYQALAPFMRDGSFLELIGDANDIWRWVFYGGKCHMIDAIELWPKPGTPADLAQQIHTAFEQHLMD